MPLFFWFGQAIYWRSFCVTNSHRISFRFYTSQKNHKNFIQFFKVVGGKFPTPTPTTPPFLFHFEEFQVKIVAPNFQCVFYKHREKFVLDEKKAIFSTSPCSPARWDNLGHNMLLLISVGLPVKICVFFIQSRSSSSKTSSFPKKCEKILSSNYFFFQNQISNLLWGSGYTSRWKYYKDKTLFFTDVRLELKIYPCLERTTTSSFLGNFEWWFV